MDTWTLQMGYPLIEVRCENNTVKAAQKRFLLNPAENETGVDVPQSPFKYKWYVPLTYVTDVKPRSMQLAWMNMSDCKFLSVLDIFYLPI